MAVNFNRGNRLGNRKATSQNVKARPDQVQNNAGGYVFQISVLEQVRRFLILGSLGPTYYVSGEKQLKDNIAALNKALDTEGTKVVDLVVKVSLEGLAQKNDYAIYALAVASAHSNNEVRSYALKNLSKVCRIPTHLFTFLTYVSDLRGFGRGLKNAVANWYNQMDANKLAMQVCKYGSRRVEGELPWTHRDALRVSHPVSEDNKHNTIYKYCVKGAEGVELSQLKRSNDLAYIYWHEKAMNAKNESDLIDAIEQGGLTHESCPKTMLTKNVYDVLVQKMPYTALIRQLGKLTEIGTLKPLNSNVRLVCDKLTDETGLQKARVHPMSVLMALRTYESGHGVKGHLSWTVIPQICDALEEAFYLSFKFVEASNKNIVIGVDVSGSMSSPFGDNPISCCEAATVIAMVVARKEPNYYIHGFAGNFVDLGITAKDTLQSATRKAQLNNFGSTDCALPMIWARKNQVDADAFIVLTDSETWQNSNYGNEPSGQPYQELKKYRDWSGKQNAKLIVVGMTASPFSIVPDDDKNGLNVVGMDSAVPQVISDFIAERI